MVKIGEDKETHCRFCSLLNLNTFAGSLEKFDCVDYASQKIKGLSDK